MEDEVIKSPSDQNERLEKLFGYVDEQIVNRCDEKGSRIKGCKAMGWWFPFWEVDITRDEFNKRYQPEERRHSLKRSLFEVLTYAHEQTGKRDPVLLELGSGDGIVCFEAAIANFNVVGVEIDTDAYQQSLKYQRDLEDQGIIDKGKITLKKGVYYLDKYWDGIQTKWKEQYPLMEERILYLGDSSQPDDPEELRRKYEAKMAEYSQGTSALETYLDPEGKLNVDVVFWYPSDSMAEAGKEQWDNTLKPGVLFVLPKNSAQTTTLQEQGFFDSYRLLRDDPEFVVYQKK